jgi:hypothetical protein
MGGGGLQGRVPSRLFTKEFTIKKDSVTAKIL